MSNSFMEARITRRDSLQTKMWVVGDNGEKGKNYAVFAKELKKGKTLQGDAVILDSNGNNKIDKDDTVLRVSNLSVLTVSADKQNNLNYAGNTVFSKKPEAMTLEALFKELTGSGTIKNRFKDVKIDGKPMIDLFKELTPPEKTTITNKPLPLEYYYNRI